MTRSTDIVQAELGVPAADLTAPRLLQIVQETIGPQRTHLEVEAIKPGPLPERHRQLGDLAATVVGAHLLGPDWWTTPLPLAPWDPTDTTIITGEQVLAGAPHPPWYSPMLSVVEFLSCTLADATADPAIDGVDLNAPWRTDRIDLPDDAREGDRVVVYVDAGERVDAVVERWDDSTLHSRLDLDSYRSSAPAQVAWAVSSLLGRGRHLLPDEEPGTTGDPYQAPLKLPRADLTLIEDELAHHGHPVHLSTAGDAVDALTAVELDAHVHIHKAWQVLWRLLANQPDEGGWRLYQIRALRGLDG